MRPFDAPLKVSIDLTHECNLACGHCRCRGTSAASAVDTEHLLRLIDELAAMRVFRVAFSGGEPLLRPDAGDIIEYAARVSCGRVSVSTNGTLLDDALLDRLRPWRQKVALHMSLDGPPRVHDTFRGLPGAHETTTEALLRAISRGFRTGVTTTVTSVNAETIDQVATHVLSVGCARWNVVEVLPVGAAGADLLPSAAQRIDALATVRTRAAELERAGIDLRVRLPFIDGRRARCMGGITDCGVTASGQIVGCRLLPHISEGSIAETSLQETWMSPSAFAAFRQAPLPDACASCSEAEACRGGCKATIQQAGGRDPRCPGASHAAP